MITMKAFGGRVESVWQGLRPATRSLVERALRAAQASAEGERHAAATRSGYDACSEWELSRLLAALDERACDVTAVATLSSDEATELVRVTETCVVVLRREARSAEVFAQLLERAFRASDYAEVDSLADAVMSRLAPSETCELARHAHPAVRAIANETLLLTPTSALVSLLGDPVDAEIARDALEQQADELESEEARWVVNALDVADSSQDDI